MSSIDTAAFTSPLAESLAPGVTERLVRYARVDTQSDRERAETSPSTEKQWDLLRLLESELQELALQDITLDDNGYLFATLPGTVDDAPIVGLLAHVDVSPDAPSSPVEPLIHRGYDGSVIELPKGDTVLDPERMPALRGVIGGDLVTTSGDTLLGADDKAGVAEIVTAVAHLVANPDLPRPTLRIGFTPDEEIGIGPKRFDVDAFGARCAYTMDGSALGELQFESFTGSAVDVTFTGVDIHPGTAKGIMVNASRLAGRFLAELPPELSPEATDGREGFVHPVEIHGDNGSARVNLIARDFEEDLLAQHIKVVRDAAERVVAAAPGATVDVSVTPQYPNMRDHLAPFPEVVANAEEALRAEGIEPVSEPIRGGTDGSQLSAMGLPTPNIFTGGHEYHSVREWASVREMAAASAVIVHLAEVWSRQR